MDRDGELTKAEILKNISKPAEHVKHAELERVCDSEFKSVCPFCNQGGLWVQRLSTPPYTLLLIATCAAIQFITFLSH